MMVNRINPCVESIWIFFGKQQVAPSTHLGRQQGSYPSNPRAALMWCDYHAWGRSAFVYPLLRFPPCFANFFRFRVIISFIWHPLEIERITNIMNGILRLLLPREACTHLQLSILQPWPPRTLSSLRWKLSR